MSIILKALKKAETSSGNKPAQPSHASHAAPKRNWTTIVVAICTIALGFFFAAYLFKGSQTPEVTSTPANVAASPSAPSIGLDSASALNSDAVIHLRAGRSKEAESLLRTAVSRYPNDPYLRNHLALSLKKQGHLSEAAMEYEEAIELKPDYYIAMNNLAVTLEAMGQKDRARELYEKALAGDPAMSGAHLNYALFLEDKGSLNEAEDHYHTFLTLSKDESLRGLVRRRLFALR